MSSPIILGIGNPLLDISSKVDQAFLEKYGLKNADQILAEDKHQPMYEELSSRPDVEYIAGGATQNSVRIAQWMLGGRGETAYMGCVGKDKYADKMKAQMDKDGCKAAYLVDESTPTGTCGVCVVNNDRSLVANLAAANNYKVEHLSQPDNWALVEAAKVVYSAGFFITVSPDSIAKTAAHCNAADKVYCMNLSAPFIMQVPPFKACLMETMPKIDVLFGNETEAETFAEVNGWTGLSRSEIAVKIAGLPKENGDGHTFTGRTVVITQGAEPTIVATQDGKVETFPVIPLTPEQLVDTNGAGDAFVGGCLVEMFRGKEPAEWCKAGAYAASVIVQQSGCTFPAKCEYEAREPVTA